MKSRLLTLALCVVAVVILLVRVLPHGGARRQPAAGPRAGSGNVYAGLRDLVLNGNRANFGLGPGSNPTQPFAVVADWGSAEGATTIVAIGDGSASVYLSSGGGFIGGGQAHESIRNAALRTVELAGAAQPLMHSVTQYPAARAGEVTFYAVTDAGVFGATASQDDLSGGRSPFSEVAAAAQDILAEYRRLPEARR
jgi:hypothetical protein